jgi:hypothetical protein
MLKTSNIRLAFLLVGLGTTYPNSQMRGADFKALPNDTECVLTVNFKQIRECDLVMGDKDALDQPRQMFKRLAADVPILKCLQDAGIDFFRDLTAIRFGCPRGKHLSPAFVVLEGDFDALKLGAHLTDAARANPDSVKSTTAGESTIYEIALGADNRNYAVLADNKTLIAGKTRETLMEVLARANGAGKQELPKGLKALLEATDEKQSISIVATGPVLSALMDGISIPNADTLAAALKAVDGVSCAVTLTREFNFQIGVYARDDDSARKIASAGENALTTLRGLARQKAREDNRLLPLANLIETLRIKSEGATLNLRGEATLDLLEKLISDPQPAGGGGK